MNDNDKAVMFSSESTEYGTPEWVWRPVAKALDLDFDAASSFDNRLFPNYATQDGTYVQHFSTPHKESDLDGLATPWTSRRVWCNPPYGRGVTEEWVKKAGMETFYYGTDYGSELVVQARCPVAALLLPARTDTDWFQRWVAPLATVYFIQGRIKFIGAKDSAPFPSMIAVYDGHPPKAGHVNARLWDPRSQPEFPYDG